MENQEIIDIVQFPFLLNYINVICDIYPSIGIARTGFERGDLFDKS